MIRRWSLLHRKTESAVQEDGIDGIRRNDMRKRVRLFLLLSIIFTVFLGGG